MKTKKSIAVIGGGASTLMFACIIDTDKYDVTIYERNNTPGRKLLVAGDGGFNLTHSEELETFITRYIPSSFLEKSIRSFTNIDLQQWFKEHKIETYAGTSKRIFPIKGIKPIDVLTVFLNVLKQNKIEIKTQHLWKGWNKNNRLLFENNNNIIAVKPDITVFSLGGASWKVTGSDGSWLTYFNEKNINTLPFMPSNCAVKINWHNQVLKTLEGKSLKNISVSINNKTIKGELVITQFGLEGGAIYALIGEIRNQLKINNTASVYIDFKPSFSIEKIKSLLTNRGNKSISIRLESALNINNVQLQLLKTLLSKEEFTDVNLLAEKIKKLPITITSLAPIDEAISTVGGISQEEVDSYFQLKKLPDSYCIGEMLDWDAPTGGYLLQGCFSMGYFLANKLNG